MTGKILLLESRSGKVPQMITFLSQLKQLGVFDKVSGILLGTFTEMESEKCTPTIEELVKEERNGKYSLERISKIIEEWFKLEINNYEFNEKLIRLSEFLNQMYHYITINGEGYTLENHKYYIDNEKIEELLFSIMSKLIDNNKNYSALGILQPRHALNVIFKNCCVQFFIENEFVYDSMFNRVLFGLESIYFFTDVKNNKKSE